MTAQARKEVMLRRIFRNENGDWDKLEKHLVQVQTYAKVVDDLAKDLVTADAKLKTLLLEAYQMAPMVDCLFYDSPVSPDRQTLALKSYLKKLNWSGIRDIFTESIEIKKFSDTIKDGCRWLQKFQKEDKK